MNDAEWRESVQQLSLASDQIAILGRCLDVSSQLEHWRQHHDVFSGVDAANALDQASGLLGQLAKGGASEMLQHVEALQRLLPDPWE